MALRRIVLRRDKSVIEDLLKGKDDHVVFCTMTPLQVNIYQRVLESPDYRILGTYAPTSLCRPYLQRSLCARAVLVWE